MEEAICISPMNPELYYLSARLELSRIVSDAADTSTCTTESCGKTSGGRVHRVGKAVEWLSRCVRAFYKTDSAETMCTAQVLSLYRYELEGDKFSHKRNSNILLEENKFK